MKMLINVLSVLIMASLLSGCFAQCNYLAREIPDENGTVIGTVFCENSQYKLLFSVPISAGKPWKEGPYSEWNHGIDFFSTHNLLMDNMQMVRLVQEELGGSHIAEIRTEVETKSAWSLFLIDREVFRTSATIMK